MAEGIHSGIFQGRKVQGCFVDRKPGVNTDYSWVEMSGEDVKQIALEEDFRLWGSGGFKEPAGPYVAAIAAQLRGPGQTRTDTPPGPAGKLRRGGTLTLLTESPGGGVGGSDNDVTITPLFLASSGIDEILIDLAEARKHNQSKVRLNLVDIRYFWQDHGHPVYGRYNITSESGTPDPDTANPKTGQPYTLLEILDYLCLCLPGSPTVTLSKELGTPKAPVNLDMKMEAPIRWLQRLMDIYKLDLHLTRQSQVYISSRGNHHTPGSFPTNAGGTAKRISQNPNSEKKTVNLVEKPEAVIIVGGQRERRETMAYEPAFIDLDGKVRRMKDLPQLWGYSIDKARTQITLQSAKAWQDVSGPDPITRVQRIKVAARDFFRLYAPSALFIDSDNAGAVSGGRDVATGGGTKVYWDFSLRKHPFFPALDPWWARQELQILARGGFTPVTLNPGSIVVKTDPICKAAIIKQAFVRTQNDVLAFMDPIIGSLEDLKARKQAKANQLNATINAANGSSVEEPLNRGRVDQAARDLLALTSASFSRTLQLEADLTAANRQLLTQYSGELGRVQEEITSIAGELQGKKESLSAFSIQIQRFGAAKCWITAPWGAVPSGDFSFNRANGLVVFSHLAGVLNTVAALDLELAKFVGDGHVEMTFNHTLYRGVPEDWTYFYFQRGEGGGGAKFVAVSSPSALKPFIVRDERIVIYENEQRVALNAGICKDQAQVYADSLLGTSYQQDGYAYEYPGFWNLETSDAVNEVSWAFDGDEAHTLILANFPDDDQGAKSLTRKRMEEGLFYGKD